MGVIENATTIYNALKTAGATHEGACGLIGNLEHESGLIPIRKQGDLNDTSYSTSNDYTTKVNNGTISKTTFVNDSIGYGLAQWTYPSRKQGLYEKWKNDGYDSIGNLQLAIDFLLYEMYNNFRGVWGVLTSSTDLKTCSDKVLHDFESPADQSENVENERYTTSKKWCDTLSGSVTPDPDPDPDPEPSTGLVGKNVTVLSNVYHGKRYGKNVYGKKFRRFYQVYTVTAETEKTVTLAKNNVVQGTVKKDYVKEVKA